MEPCWRNAGHEAVTKQASGEAEGGGRHGDVTMREYAYIAGGLEMGLAVCTLATFLGWADAAVGAIVLG